MNYSDFSAQYAKQYTFLANYVKNLKIEYDNTFTKLKSKERLLYQKRIYLIYSMCLEMKHTGEYLKKCKRREKICQNKS